ncbi:MAG: VCBS domain-containing protein, partial [Burkholderiales bacterium]|nr:VCBS domain-containing protein [Burkholderiales bacterium]
ANDAPAANPDTNFVVDGGADATGNVLNAVTHPDGYSDQADTDVEGDTLTVTEVNGSAADVGVPLAVTYGTITLNPDGSYTYSLDPTNVDVLALVPGGTLTETVTYEISDGEGGTATSTLTITIFGVNNPPEGQDKTLTTDEDTPLVITTADFGFSDIDAAGPASEFAAVRIDTIPATGTLLLNGVPVTAGQIVSRADLDAGRLTYQAPPDLAGPALADFTFSVQDGLGDFDPVPNTITIDVTPVSDAPAVVTQPADASNDPPGQPIPLSITVTLTDTNGPAPETLGDVTIAGFPPGSVLSNDAGDTVVVPPGGAVTLAITQLPGLKVLLPTSHQTDFVLTVTASSTDGAAAPAFTVAALPVKVPVLSPPMISGGERVDPHVFGIQPPAITQVMSPDLHVQLAVRDSSGLVSRLGNQIAGVDSVFGEEIQSETLSIGQGMTNIEHVSRDGVAFSVGMLSGSQGRARMAGNGLLLGAETLFDDLAPLSSFNGQAAGEASGAGEGEAPQPQAMADPVFPREIVAGAPTDEDVPRVPERRPVPGSVSFSERLAQVAIERALVREGLADGAHLRPVKSVPRFLDHA